MRRGRSRGALSGSSDAGRVCPFVAAWREATRRSSGRGVLPCRLAGDAGGRRRLRPAACLASGIGGPDTARERSSPPWRDSRILTLRCCLVRPQPAHPELIEVPDFRGMQALNAWLFGHDRGLLLTGPDPDSSQPLLHGVVVDQAPVPGGRLHRWDVVTVWIRHGPGDSGGVREPRRPLTPVQADAVALDPPLSS